MSNLTVIEQNGNLVIDSRLIATELVVSHKSFLETIRKHQNEIEAAFGQLHFQTASVQNNVGAVNNVTFAYLNEEQAAFAMTLSRNTSQVVKAKINLVKKFSEAKKALQANSTVDTDVLAALMSKMDSLNATAVVATEYMSVRKVTDAVMPGMSDLMDRVVDNKGKLPPVEIWFTASEYLESKNADFDKGVKHKFCLMAAMVFETLVGTAPTKNLKGVNYYSNKHEIILEQILTQVQSESPKAVQLELPPTLENKTKGKSERKTGRPKLNGIEDYYSTYQPVEKVYKLIFGRKMEPYMLEEFENIIQLDIHLGFNPRVRRSRNGSIFVDEKSISEVRKIFSSIEKDIAVLLRHGIGSFESERSVDI